MSKPKVVGGVGSAPSLEDVVEVAQGKASTLAVIREVSLYMLK